MRFNSFREMIGFYAENTPEAPALKYEKDGGLKTESFAELLAAVDARASELKKGGKTCLGLFADGSRDCIVELFAAVTAGLQLVMLDESVPVMILRGLLPYTDVDTLWGDPETCAELQSSLTSGVENGADRMLFFTSGTTERSKAVVLTEKSFCSSAYNGGSLLPLDPSDTLMCMLPLGHVFGFVCGLLWGLSCGACVALGRGPRHYIDDLAFFKPTALSAVPLLLGFLVKNGLLNEELKLVLIGAGDCPPPLIQAVKAGGVRVSFGYGLTETSSGVALSLGDDPYSMTVCPDDKITIADDGEILIDVPTCIMQGYYKDPEATARAVGSGVLRTGDLGYFDKNGLLRITGRKKDMLVLADGTKLFIPEAEAELSKLLPGVDLAVMLNGSRVVLAVHGTEMSDAELIAAIKPYQDSRPSGQQIGSFARFDKPLPRTATGKIKRWELQKKY